MSTVDFIEAGTRKNVSEIQALALTIMNAPATSAVSVKDLYTAAMQQTSAVFSNQTMPKIDESSVSYTHLTLMKVFRKMQTSSRISRVKTPAKPTGS